MPSNAVKIRPRRGAYSYWQSVNPILLEGELGIEYPDSGLLSGNIRIKIGDGVTPWNLLPYAIDPEEAAAIHAGSVIDYKELTIRTGTTTEWLASDPILLKGEIVYDETLQEVKIGDGIHNFSDLRYIGQTWDKDVIYDFGDYDNPGSV